MRFLAQYYPHLMDGPHILSGRLAQHFLLQELRLLQLDRRLLRGVHHLRILRFTLPLYRPGSTFPEGVFSRDQTETLGLAGQLGQEVLRR